MAHWCFLFTTQTASHTRTVDCPFPWSESKDPLPWLFVICPQWHRPHKLPEQSELLPSTAATDVAWGSLHLHHAVRTTSAHSRAGVTQAHTHSASLLRTKRLWCLCSLFPNVLRWRMKYSLWAASTLLSSSAPQCGFKLWKYVNWRLYVNEKTPSQASSRGPLSLTISFICNRNQAKLIPLLKTGSLLRIWPCIRISLTTPQISGSGKTVGHCNWK